MSGVGGLLLGQLPYLLVGLAVLLIPAFIIQGRLKHPKARMFMWVGVGLLVLNRVLSPLFSLVFLVGDLPVSTRGLISGVLSVLNLIIWAAGMVLLFLAIVTGRDAGASVAGGGGTGYPQAQPYGQQGQYGQPGGQGGYGRPGQSGSQGGYGQADPYGYGGQPR